MNNGDKPSMPTPDEYEYGNLVSIGEQGFTKREACGLKILCSMLTARGDATDNDLITQASQIADLWLEVVSVSRESSVEQQYKEFAKWCRENPHLGLDPRLHTHAGRIEDGGYISHGRTSSAFKAWQASRQALECEPIRGYSYELASCTNEYGEYCNWSLSISHQKPSVPP